MSAEPGSAPVRDSDAAAQRRWLITIAITVVFGGFGAVMAYLSYTNSKKPAVSSPGRSRSPSTAPTAVPPAAEPSSSGDKGKGHKDDK